MRKVNPRFTLSTKYCRNLTREPILLQRPSRSIITKNQIELKLRSRNVCSTSKTYHNVANEIPLIQDLWQILDNLEDAKDRTDLKSGNPDLAWASYLEIKESGELSTLAPNEIERLLDTLRFSALDSRVSRILMVLKDLKQMKRKLRVKDYEALFFSFASTSRFEECWLLLQEMKKVGLEPNAQVFCVIIRFLGKNCKTLSANRVFQYIISEEVSLPDKAYYALMECFIIRPDSENAMSIFRKTRELNILVPKSVLQALLRRLVDLKHINYAREVFRSLLVPGSVPSVEVITIMINGLLKDSHYEEALEIYNQYLSIADPAYGRITSLIIEAFIKSDRLDDALHLIESSPKSLSKSNVYLIISLLTRASSKLNPTDVIDRIGQLPYLQTAMKSLNTNLPRLLVKEYTNTGRLNEAEDTVTVFRNRGVPPTLHAYHMLMGGYFESDQIEKGLEVLNRLKNDGLELNPLIIEAAFKLLTKKLDLQQAESLYQDSKDSGILLSLNSFKYYMYILGHLEQDQAVQEVFLDVLDYDTYPTAELINLTMRVYIQQERFKEVFTFLTHLENSKVTPHVENFGYLIDSLVRSQLIEDAESVLNFMKRLGITPNVKMCTRIIQGYIQIKNMPQAQKILDAMLTWGIKPDTIVYAVLIRGLILDQQFSKTRELFSSMINNGLKPDVVTYSCLIGSHIIKDSIADAERFILQLKSQNIVLDGVVFSLLMDAILIKLGPSEVFRYFETNLLELLQFDEPLSFMIQKTHHHKSMSPFLIQAWSLSEAHQFPFKPDHYAGYLSLLCRIRQYDIITAVLHKLLNTDLVFQPNEIQDLKSILIKDRHQIPTEILDLFSNVFPEFREPLDRIDFSTIVD